MADNATLTIRVDGGNLFVDVVCADDEDVTLAEALGMLELAKDVLIRGEDE